jgi:glycosyltransferase involved in cell wall biosynthesis
MEKSIDGAPTVSVIIPAYNVSSYISETLNSVFSQTFQDFEVIVVDDGSPDRGALKRVLQPYSSRIVYLEQENKGPSAARNAGIRVARGTYVAFLDADDFWESNYLAVQVGYLRDHLEIDIVYPDALIFGEDLDVGRLYSEICPTRTEVNFESLLNREAHVFVSVTGKRDVFVSAGLFDESLRSCEDIDLWLRLTWAGARFATHGQKLVRYRRHKASLSADPIWMARRKIEVMERLESRLTLNPSQEAALKHAVCLRNAELHLLLGKKAMFERDFGSAIDHLTQANSHFHSKKLKVTIPLLKVAPRLVLGIYNLRDRFVHEGHSKF